MLKLPQPENKRYLIFLPLLIYCLPLVYKFYPKHTYYTGTSIEVFLFLSIAFLFICLLKTKANFKINVLDIYFFAFMFYCVVNSLIKNYPNALYIENTLTLSSIGIYLCFKRIFTHKFSIIILPILVLITGLIIEIYGYLQYFNLLFSDVVFFKITSFFINPNTFCIYLTFQFPIVIYLFLTTKTNYIKILSLIFCFNVLLFIIILSSRTAFAALILILFYLFSKTAYKRSHKRMIFLLMSSFAFMFCFISFTKKINSTKGRLLIWKVSKNMFLDDPITGSGLGTFKSRYNIYQANYFHSQYYTKEEVLLSDENYFPFNELLNILIENGLVGLFLFILLIAKVASCPQKLFLKNDKNNFLIYIKCSIYAILTFGLFLYPFSEPSIFLCFSSLISIFSVLTTSFKDKLEINKWVVNLFLIFISVTNFKTFFYFDKWIYIKDNELTNNLLIDYKNLYESLEGSPNFLYDYSIKLIALKKYDLAIKNLESAQKLLPSPAIISLLGKVYNKTNNLKKAENKFILVTEIVPGKFIPEYNLFKFYKDRQAIEKATLIAKQIVHMNIKVPSLEVDAIIQEVQSFLKNE